MSDDLSLNSIDRYRKRSSRLILEEHSSCEVPAGCGGVVLRWGRPDGGIPVSMLVNHLGESEIHCGGELRTNGRFLLPFGPGVIALHLTKRDATFDWLIVTTRHHSASWRADRREIPELSTSDDRSWLATTTQPSDDWTRIEFDDSAWQPLTNSTMPIETLEERSRWRFRLSDEGVGLGLPSGNEVWIRKRYHLQLGAE